jgi:hypothetical protein
MIALIIFLVIILLVNIFSINIDITRNRDVILYWGNKERKYKILGKI